MPILSECPEKELLATLQSTIGHLPQSYAGIAGMLQSVCDNPVKYKLHPVYVVGLMDIASKDGLANAKVCGWRYMTQLDTGRNYAVEIHKETDEGDLRFAELDKGPFIDGINDVLADENISAKIASGALQLSILRINAMGIVAIWLCSDKPSKEIVIVIPPAPPYLKPWPAKYTVKQFQDALRTVAKRRMSAGDNHP